MQDAQTAERIRRTYQALRPEMDERMRRQWAAAEARGLGYGGITRVSRATGLSRTTIAAGLAELDLPAWRRACEAARVRRPGGGRRPLTESDPGLPAALESLVEPTTRGDPESPLRWTCKSTRRLAEELTRAGHPVGRMTVASLLHEAGYSLQADRKTREGSSHPDRDAQFRYIDRMVRGRLRRERPAVSVDTKKKELVGDFRNGGREWHPAGRPPEVRVHDFVDEALGKVIPYGVYDLLNDQGWVSVGTDHDTAEFAAHSIGSWWARAGRRAADHRRRGREQRAAVPALEGLPPAAGRRAGDGAGGLPLPARHEQVEQDRAPPVQLHHAELAGPAAGQPRDGRQPDRRHPDAHRPGRRGGTGHQPLRDRGQGERRRAGGAENDPAPVPWRLELHDQAATMTRQS